MQGHPQYIEEDEVPVKRFTGYWIPEELGRLGLTKIEQLLLSVIHSLDNPAPKYCFASNKYLAEEMDLSESRISFYLTKFKRMGLIKEVGFDGRKRRMTCTKENWYKNKIEIKQKCSKKVLCVKTRSQGARKHVVRLRENTHHITKTIPKVYKGNDYNNEKSLPFHSEKGEKEEKTKFPLKKEQKPYFDEMKSLDLGIDDEKIMIKIRDAFKKGKVSQLRNAISHIREEIKKGTKFKKERIALFTQVFNGKIVPISENSQKNREYAQANRWGSLEIHDKYVKCTNSGKEISLDRPIKDFKSELNDLFELSKIYN